ncbi:ABC transporter permease subunit [Saxibacter everestensis]|uniref:ABC transporter permease subunit n=1 Tax=Saxibacter everestensis TaxID=2909229 RepID=A0ABY8QT84_9MICO|nr:ABC transporter permease subunit [Brevibacteriaceae bacterium ZFBP1038]
MSGLDIPLRWLGQNAAENLGLFGQHAWLAAVPLLVGLLLSIPVGALASKYRAAYTPTITVTGLLFTLPSLAVFVILPGVLGTQILDPINVVVALSIYTFALLVRVVADGLGSVPEEVRQSADSMGYKPLQRFFSVDLPIAVPVIIAGLRVAAVSNVSIVSVAALLGVPQLGQLLTEGFQLAFYTPIIVGIVGCLVLAAIFDGLILLAGRLLTPWQSSQPRLAGRIA